MNKKDDIGKICLAVFGKVSAAVSHELKNTLSIINENAGLLDDLAAMAGSEGGIGPQRVESAASAIMRQVSRSNTIIKNLNTFAHSGDAPIARAGLDGVLGLVVALAARQAAMKKIEVDLTCPPDLMVQTDLLSLESLLYLVLCRLYSVSEEGSTIRIEAADAPQGAAIRFAVEGGGCLPEEYPYAEEDALAQHIGASFLKEESALALNLPLNNEGF